LAVCVVGTVVWLVVATIVSVRWLAAGRAPLALRAGAAAGCAGLLFAGLWFEVRFAAYDGCSWSTGDQPC